MRRSTEHYFQGNAELDSKKLHDGGGQCQDMHMNKAERAKTGRAGCKKCKEKIGKDELRVAVLTCPVSNFLNDEARAKYDLSGKFCAVDREDVDDDYWEQLGEMWRWHHLDCFAWDRAHALKSVDDFSTGSYDSLSPADQKTVAAYIGGGSAGAGAGKAAGKAAGKPVGKAKPKAKAVAKPAAKPAAKAAGTKRAAAPKEAPSKAKRSKAESSSGGDLEGKTVVFTGSLSTKRAEATTWAEEAGARVTGTVSKNTHIVIAGPGGGAKLDKANELCLDVWDEAQFLRAVGH